MAIFGSRASRPVHWLNTGLVEARRVGRIHGKAAKVVATGFLLDGGIIADDFKSLPLLLTCNHCVFGVTKRHDWGIPWTDGAVVFQQMQTDASVKGEAAFLQLITESPIDELNYTFLLLDRWPGSVPELKVAPDRPQPGDKVFVISYPRGEGLAVSLDDNLVVPAPPPEEHTQALAGLPPEAVLHYSAPTQPGDSGAPVFNEHWEVVAVHTGRSKKTNFGVAMDSIIEDARDKLRGFSVLPAIRGLIGQQAEQSPQVLMDDARYFSVFISHSHADAPFARRLWNAFKSRGIRAWLDDEQIVPGEDIHEAVQKGIEGSDKFLLCCSKAALDDSWWVDSELEQILERERNLWKTEEQKTRLVIPVTLDNHLREEWKGAKATELRRRSAVDFNGWKDEKEFEQSFERLLRAFRPNEP